jgi:hypothetical protein
MGRKRYTVESIVRSLREAEVELGAGHSAFVPNLCHFPAKLRENTRNSTLPSGTSKLLRHSS